MHAERQNEREVVRRKRELWLTLMGALLVALLIICIANVTSGHYQLDADAVATGACAEPGIVQRIGSGLSREIVYLCTTNGRMGITHCCFAVAPATHLQQ